MKDKFHIIISTILLLVLVLSGCKAELEQPTETPTTESMDAAATEILEPTIEPTPDPYPDWERYTNEIYGFSFRYPSTWVAEETSFQNQIGGTTSLLQLSQESLTLYIEHGFANELIGIGGAGIGAGDIQSLGEVTFFDQEVSTSALVYQEKTKIIFYNEPGGTIQVSDLVFSLSLQDNAQISYEDLNIPEDIQAEVAEILDSFEEVPRTVEPPDPYPGWEAYINTDHGFTFRYPPEWELEEVSSEEEGGSFLRSVNLSRDGNVLFIDYHFSQEYIINPMGIGAGELQYEGTISFLGREIEKLTLIFEEKDKTVIYGGDIEVGDLTFNLSLQYEGQPESYETIEVLDEIQVEAEQILNTFQLIMAQAAPPEPQILTEGRDQFVAFGGCFDLDEGMETADDDPGCDFSVGPGSGGETEIIQFMPQPPAAFGFGGVFVNEPALSQCAYSETLSSAEETNAPLSSHHVCFQTNLGHFGYLIFKGVTSDGVTFSWRTFTASGPFAQPTDLSNAAIYLADVTVPDGTVFEPGETFTKTWKLMNTGETTWTTGYAIRFKEGDRMNGPYESRLSDEIPPDGRINVSVDLTAPEEPGEYRGDWYLRDANGKTFGLGEDGDLTFYVIIVVEEGGEAKPTEGPSGSEDSPVTEVTLEVDPNDYEGVCPVTINVTGMIFSEGTDTYVYELEAGAENPNFQFYLPTGLTANFGDTGANQQVLSYSLSIQNSVDAWVRMFISSPGVYRSGKVYFKITCE